MKIIYCLHGTYNSGGMERIVINKANYLAKIGHDVSIVTTEQKGHKPFLIFILILLFLTCILIMQMTMIELFCGKCFRF